MDHDYSRLQNGSDIRGVAVDLVPSEPVTLDEEAVRRLSGGFLYFLKVTTGRDPDRLRIAIGRDSRLSGPALEGAAAEAMASLGAKVLRAGLASTPAMFMATVFPEFDCDGAVMLTASHLPANRNGMKFFTRSGGLDKGDITDIINFAGSDRILAQMRPLRQGPAPAQPAAAEEIDLMGRYAGYLRELIIKGAGPGSADPARPLAGLKIAVDAGNGAGGFYATEVLAPLGADISGSQFLEPDGSFPNHQPNPENKAAIASISEAVRRSHSDLGIIFDTDVDRAAAVDERGEEISRNGIVAMAAALIAGEHPGTTVVTDSITSRGLKKFLEQDLGLRHLRFRRGYRNVINKAIELNNEGLDCQLAIETSGHCAYRENRFLDDGAYLATRIVVKTTQLAHSGGEKRGISSVLANLREAADVRELRLPLKPCREGEGFAEAADRILKDLHALVRNGGLNGFTLEEPNYEGVRCNFDGRLGTACMPTGAARPAALPTPVDGWFLLRKSLHDPIMPLNLEADVPGGVDIMLRALRPFLERFPELDLSELRGV